MGFLADTETAVTSGFTSVVTTFGAGLLDTFRPAFIVGFTIWITLIAYEVAFGKSEDGFTYIFTKIGKIFLMGVIALYGWPSLAELLSAVKDGFVGANTMSTILETNLMNPITQLWVRLFDWFIATLGDIGWTELGRLISALALFGVMLLAYVVMSIVVGLFGAVALAMYLVASSAFILLLAIGPFFLLCLAFPFLQRFFETYIGNVMTAILAMAFTVLMVMFVADLFGLVGIHTIVPTATDPDTIYGMAKSLAVLFASKAAMTLLIIYLYYKVFDLAASLGGGLNMGNNLVNGVRSILRDMQGGGHGRNNTTNNTIAQGSTGSGVTASQRAGAANRTLTGMALSAGSRAAGPAISAVGQTAIAGAQNVGRIAGYGGALAAGAAGRAAGAVGRYAYNRYSQYRNRMSAG